MRAFSSSWVAILSSKALELLLKNYMAGLLLSTVKLKGKAEEEWQPLLVRWPWPH
jgi:hypothetical protein